MSNIFEVTTQYCIDKRNQVFEDYTKGKRKWSQESLDKWELGFFPNKDLLSLKVRVKSAGMTIEDLTSVYIMKENQGQSDWSAFFNRIIFPVCDFKGKHIAITGRVLDKKIKPKYFNTEFEKAKTLYGLNFAIPAIREQDIVYVFEGNADVITAHQHGVENSVCVMGTAMTDDHLILLSRYTKNIVLLFDNDTGGLKALNTFNKKNLDEKRKSTNIYRCSFKHFTDKYYKDTDDFITDLGKQDFVDFVNRCVQDRNIQKTLKEFEIKQGR